MKKPINSLRVCLQGFMQIQDTVVKKRLTCIITNDRLGKTLSICNDDFCFTIPFEPIERYLK